LCGAERKLEQVSNPAVSINNCMKISALLEVTAVDLFRKIDGLDAMIADPATTAGEKQNAQELKRKLQSQTNGF
jgi:hypothetical protein